MVTAFQEKPGPQELSSPSKATLVNLFKNSNEAGRFWGANVHKRDPLLRTGTETWLGESKQQALNE